MGGKWTAFFMLPIAVALLSACVNTPEPAPVQEVASYSPPEVDPVISVEHGMASWYGPGFHGRQTASGEVFDRNEMTAAHRDLPLPSFVRVTNLDNGRSVILRVNDRGPVSSDLVIDVSEEAAEELGFIDAGVVPVRVDVLSWRPAVL